MTRRPLVVLAAAAVAVTTGGVAAGAWAGPAAPRIPSAIASVSPQPGARYAEAQTEIAFRGVPSSAVTHVTAVGSRSGAHTGRILADSDGNGASLVPSSPFAKGESVRVSAPLHIAGARNGQFSFTVGVGATIAAAPKPLTPGTPKTQTFKTEPTLHPAVTTSTRGLDTTPGLTFTAPYGLRGLSGNEITDDSGQVVYYAPTRDATADFRVQTYRGKPVLTWWEGSILLPGFGRGDYVMADTSYHVIKRFPAADDLAADSHEFVLTPQNTALITSYAPETVDARAAGGNAHSVVLDGVVQEYDIATGRVLFEWHALDHIPLTDSYVPATAGSAPWDAFHVNSVQPYGNNSLLVSLRSDHQLAAISRSTGAVSLTIGGKHSTIRDSASLATHSQHDAEPHSDGTISVFDNGAGAGGAQHRTSRGLVVKITSAGLHLVTTLAAPDGQLAYSQGNVQALGSGYLVDFGSAGTIATYDAKGHVLSDVHYQRGVQTYRALKSVWHATPATLPKIVVAHAGSGAVTYVSWNGATEVASWRVLSGPDAGSLTPVGTAGRSGFETGITISTGSGTYAVQALDASGKVLATSAPAALQ